MFSKENFFNIKNKISPKKYRLILKIGKLADEYGINAYLVGGMVRDLLTGKKDADIDITVEGDGIRFTEFLAKKFNLPFKCFEKFKTGKIFLQKGENIDISSARAEKYKRPGALPDVNFAIIKDDLSRRDFTINAMAVQINQRNFGLFIDFFNGITDLKKGIIRVLHNKSFLDDPTRIIRAIRFKTRFGFKIDKNTEKLLKKALKKDVFKTVSAERISNEIFLILSEKNVFDALLTAQKYGILKKIYKNLKIKNYIKKYFIKTDDLILRFLILIYELNKRQAIELVTRLKLSRYFKNAAIVVKKYQKKIFKIFKKKMNYEKELFNIFKNSNSEFFNYFILFCENKKMKNYLLKIKNTKIELTGDDLIKLGLKQGVEIGKILDKIRYNKINGQIKNRVDEINFVKKYIKMEV